MRARFHPKPCLTEILFLKDISSITRKAEGSPGWLLVDAGVPGLGSLSGDRVLRMEGGEGVKRWDRLERILSWLAENRAERSQPLVVMGGGALLDLGAFAASVYRRGMPLVLVPTTLLGMVDATLGGKTAVDHEQSESLLKNFAGTFYPASEIWISPAFLESLPERERRSGAGEVAKTLWISGKKWRKDPLLKFVGQGQVSGLLPLLKECLSVKAKLVAKDPLDTRRIREVLNFGHTAGHALEGATALSHGEAVLWGMAIESSMIGAKPMLKEVLSFLRALGLELPGELKQTVGWESYLTADKKMKSGILELSLLTAPGKVVKRKVPAAQLASAIRAFPEFFLREGSNPRA